MPEDPFTKHLGKQIKEKGMFIARIEFIEVPGEGIVTGSKVNPDFFPGPQVAADVIHKMRELFMNEMQRIGAFKPTDISIQ